MAVEVPNALLEIFDVTPRDQGVVRRGSDRGASVPNPDSLKSL